MQRTISTILIVCLAALMLGSCAQRKIIPDDELADIFCEAYLSNSYLGIEYANLDSLKIYEPILANHGYTPEDLRYTIGNFSRRKSAQLGTVLKQAEERLVKEAAVYEQKVVVLDTIRDVAIRRFKRTVRADSLIVAQKIADTAKLRIVVEPIYPGSYAVRFKYDCEDNLERYPRNGSMWLESSSNERRSNHTFRLRRKDSARRTFATDTSHQRLVIWLGEMLDKDRSARNPKIKIHDLQIVYTPDEATAIDSLMKSFIDITLFTDEFYPKTDSLASVADTTRVR